MTFIPEYTQNTTAVAFPTIYVLHETFYSNDIL